MLKQAEALFARIKESGAYDYDKIYKAYEYAEKLHAGQKRISGEEYIVHPLSVAEEVINLQLDTDSICAAFLHDTVEDCGEKVDLSVIRKEFGPDVAEIVDGVTKLVHIPFETKQDESIENLRKMFLAMSKDLRVIFVKLCDRLHNMRTLDVRSPEKQRSIALETMHVYAPLAHRLGIQKIKNELETLALYYLDPIGYAEVSEDISKRYGESKDFLDRATEKVAESLRSYNVDFTLSGRVKTIYSIYKKMYNQSKQFDEIYDFYALRIIVDTELDCYTALGIIHEQFNSIPGRFKDYISTPKPNMYRSLHTTVIGKEGIPFEVQIRTWEMHQVAEFGIAAHWKYKTGEQVKADIDAKLQWIRTLVETEKDVDDPDEFFRPLKIDLFEDEIFVFTPKGDVVNLPNNSTPIDFAYAIHSAVGNKMVGAKVNGNIVPIDSILETGQIVEVLTSASSKGPSRDWLKIVRSGEARNKIRQYFKKEMRPENIAVGKTELEREIKRYGRHYTEAQKTEIMKNLANRLSLPDVDDLYNNIGYGGLSVSKIAVKLREEFMRVVAPQAEVTAPVIPTESSTSSRYDKTSRGNADSVIVDSVEGCTVKFAKCCNPLPGDSIIGYITRGYGVSIHKYDCPNAQSGLSNPNDKDRWVVASWSEKLNRQTVGSFEAVLSIIAEYTPHLIADITLALTDMKVAITSLATRENAGEMVTLVGIKCSGVDHLRNIISNLHRIKGVREVSRGSL
ncbi:MAG: bifunctional (p)ppGpp synthetase/guanosine-3',5'-bis(diphosphate) 3'-pyrophosphohydrolase [Clostridia bacterium]|nr:bifunctional (p)ppGpp synthetase/guanosine-3',5'-bis(diphosphate) 3'-pyrophosphohydrolase [Clostridia bacterium]MBQ5837335.1 bifunctional (p)ppGpp synthetase/guanosine-3',5'-bis(diphosphate) 3'-pyrophosphohydrolase [Clostridia bacterium]